MLQGEIVLPGDKSISHRAIMLNSIAKGKATITNILHSADTYATIDCFRQLGVRIDVNEQEVIVNGKGLSGLQQPDKPLNCENSGTTARLLLGLLSGLAYRVTLTGDASLKKRPMMRVVKQLHKLGANISLSQGDFLPAMIHPSTIKQSAIELDVASAQVKSAAILAAIKSDYPSHIREVSQTRDHTERMLAHLGCDIKTEGLTITVSGMNHLEAKDIQVPGDISSAAFFIVAALMVPGSHITLLNCGLNETRRGILTVLDRIQADYQVNNKRLVCNEVVGDLEVTYTEQLEPFHIKGDLVPLLIDELPILALLATHIKGTSIIEGAEELRVKETDRIHAVVHELKKLGAHITERPDGMVIEGKSTLVANPVKSYHDHRISMMLKVARLVTDGSFKIENDDCDRISYPNFEEDLRRLLK